VALCHQARVSGWAAAHTLGVLEACHRHTAPTPAGVGSGIQQQQQQQQPAQSIQQGVVGLGEAPSSRTLIRFVHCIAAQELSGAKVLRTDTVHCGSWGSRGGGVAGIWASSLACAATIPQHEPLDEA
jgi:hypothetical protein